MVTLTLRRGKEESLLRRHPWIFSGAIHSTDGTPEEGDVVEVRTASGDFIARGHCGIGSIAVRVLTFDEGEPIDSAFWERRIAEAYRVREALGLTASAQTTCYRLVHGEGDGLPGLVVDIYGSTAVTQAHSVGMYLVRDEIAAALRKVYGDRLTAVYDKSAGTVPPKSGIGAVDGYLWRSDAAVPAEETVLEGGNRLIRFEYEGIFEEILDQLGQMPLPPYITHQLKDKDRYNTVYAEHSGSAAAPTAGLHFTPELLKEIEEKGVDIARVTLHVGLGTFRPVKVDDVENHHMHSEFYMIDEEAAEKINRAKENGKRVICVGTTSCRTVESAADENGRLKACSGWTEIFIYPGYRFKILDALITNFHLPESTLIMLVSALAGKEHVLAAYEEAVRERYRFFSFGDAMFIK